MPKMMVFTINLKAAQVNFTAVAESTANPVTFTKVGVSVLQANPSTGVFETQEGNTDADFATFDQLGGSLQVAYGLGNSITTASSTAIQFTLSSGDFKVDDGTVDFGSATALTAFNSVAAATSIESTGTSGGDLFLSHANSGSAGIALGHSGSTQQLGVDVNGIALDDDGTFGKATGSAQRFTKDGSGGAADDLEIAMIMSGTVTDSSLILSSDGNGSDAIKIQTLTNAGGIQIDSDGGLDVFSDDTTQIIMDANDAGAKTLTIQSNNAGAGAGNIQINADDTVEIVGQLQADATAGVGLKFGSSGNVVDTILDEDTMASDDVNALATQQSIKAYVDGVGVSDFSKIAELTAAGNISAGNVVAINSSGEAIQANAGAASTAEIIGVAIETVTTGNAVRIAQAGTLSGFSGLTAGEKQFASTTAGGLTSTAPSASGDVVFQIGYAKAADTIVIVPQYIMEIG
jgi:hypothetical protein